MLRAFLIVLFAALAFVPLAWCLRRNRVPRLIAGLPIGAYLALVGFIAVADKYWVQSLGHFDYRFWVLGWLVYGFGFAFPILYGLCFWLAGRRGLERGWLGGVWGLFVFFGVATSYSAFVEPRLLKVQEYEFVSDRAPPGELLILHVSDLQTDGPCLREEKARAEAASRKPDLVIFTGDIANDVEDLDGRAERIESARLFFQGLDARLGVFAVPGDWDGWADDWDELLQQFLAGSKVRWLNNEQVLLEDGAIALYGVGSGPGLPGEPRPPNFQGVDAFRLVVAHHPDDIDDLIVEGGADLTLAGHTHGGQVVLPLFGALTTRSDLGFAGGMHKNHGVPIIVSRGIGMRGGGAPRIRFGCKPEVSWITVRQPHGTD